MSLVEKKTHDLSLADGVFGFILQVAVYATHVEAGMRLTVQPLFVRSVRIVHRVAEAAAELGGTRPMHDGRTGGNERNAQHNADDEKAADEPLTVSVHKNSP